MTSLAQIRFPAIAFRSFEDFRLFRERQSDILDERYRREMGLGTTESALTLQGTCAACLDVSAFRSQIQGGHTLSDGRVVPNWREEQLCGCVFALNSRERALLHVCLRSGLGDGFSHAAVLGVSGRVLGFVQSLEPDAVAWPQLERRLGRLTIQAADACVDLLASPDHLQFVPEIDTALEEIARVLVPGGTAVLSVPFDVKQYETVSDLSLAPRQGGEWAPCSRQPLHRFGWDLLTRMQEVGFSDSVAHLYWSEELGYLGPLNMVFTVHR